MGKRALNNIQALWFLPRPVRNAILRRMDVEVGTRALVEPGVHFRGGPVLIGAYTYINTGCFFDAGGGITIGAHCHVGQRVDIATASHRFGDATQRAGEWFGEPVVIGDGCWLGAEVMVLPGVTIAPGCIIGARALVTRDTESNGLYVGSPAVRVRDLDPATVLAAA
jgi:acetyltransferase-like isoleucine patch superfamily enzyme